jgi:hypothetical protein
LIHILALHLGNSVAPQIGYVTGRTGIPTSITESLALFKRRVNIGIATEVCAMTSRHGVVTSGVTGILAIDALIVLKDGFLWDASH